MSTTSPPESAAQRALRLPEIAALIVDTIDQDVYARNGLNGDPSRFPDLINQSSVDALQLKRRALGPLACLNHMWFAVTIPRLWRHACMTWRDPCLNTLFRAIAPARRSLYAQYVQRGAIKVFKGTPDPCYCAHRVATGQMSGPCPHIVPENVLSEIDFPRLRWLVLRGIEYGDGIPQLGRNCVEAIFLDRHKTILRAMGARLVESRVILDQLPVMFPQLQSLHPKVLLPACRVVFSMLRRRVRAKRASEPGNQIPFDIDIRDIGSNYMGIPYSSFRLPPAKRS